MTPEQTVFLNILSDHLEGRTTGPCRDVDWNRIIQYATIHGLQGIVYYQCRGWLRGFEELENQYYSILQLGIQRKALLAEMKSRFSQADIPVFFVKGPEVANLYPVPFLRTMGDMDLVARDVRRAEDVLLKMGAEHYFDREDREIKFAIRQFLLELHGQLLYNDIGNTPEQMDYFNSCWQHYSQGAVDWNFHFMFLVMHLKKHLFLSGAGFRQFVDLAVAAQNAPVDWQTVQAELSRLGLWRFTETCFAFIERWFEIASPVPVQPLDDAFFEAGTSKVFADGVFGLDNAENAAKEAINLAVMHARPYGVSAALRIVRMVFPPYGELQHWPGFAFLKGRPYLMPAGWILRVWRRLTDGRWNDVRTAVAHSLPSAEQIDEQKRIYQDWGL